MFSKSTTARFAEKHHVIPGPGAYEVPQDSKKTTTGFGVGRRWRSPSAEQRKLGPGSYSPATESTRFKRKGSLAFDHTMKRQRRMDQSSSIADDGEEVDALDPIYEEHSPIKRRLAMDGFHEPQEVEDKMNKLAQSWIRERDVYEEQLCKLQEQLGVAAGALEEQTRGKELVEGRLLQEEERSQSLQKRVTSVEEENARNASEMESERKLSQIAIETLRNQSAEHDVAIRALMAQKLDLEGQLSLNVQRLLAVQSEHASLFESLKMAENRLFTSAQEMACLQEHLAHKTEELGNWKHQVGSLEARVSHLDQELKCETSRTLEFQQLHQDRADQCNTLESRVAHLQQLVKGCREALDAAKEDADSSSAEIDKLEQALSAKERYGAGLQSSLEEAKLALSKVQAELGDSSKTLDRMAQARFEVEQAKKASERDLNAVIDSLKQSIGSVKTQLTHREEQVEQLVLEMNALREQMDMETCLAKQKEESMIRTADDLSHKLSASSQEVFVLQERLESSTRSSNDVITNLKRKLVESDQIHESTVSQAEFSAGILRAELTKRKQELEEKSKSLIRVEQLLDNLKGQHQQAERSWELLHTDSTSKLQEQQRVLAEAHSQYSELTQTHNAVLRQLTEQTHGREEALVSLESESKQHQLQLEELRAKLQDASGLAQQQASTIEARDEGIRRLRQDLAGVESRLESRIQEYEKHIRELKLDRHTSEARGNELLSKANERLDGSASELARVLCLLQEKSKELEEATETLHEMKSKLDTATLRCQDMSFQIQENSSELSRVSALLKSSLDSAKINQMQAEDTLQQVNQEKENWKKSAQDAQAHSAQLSKELSTAISNGNEARREAADKTKVAEVLKTRLDDAAYREAQLRLELQQSVGNCEVFTNQSNSKSEELSAAHRQLAVVQAKVIEQEKSVESLKQEIGKLRVGHEEEKNSLSKHLAALMAKTQNLKQSKTAAEGKVVQLQQQYELVQQSSQAMQRTCSEQMASLSEAQQKHAELAKQCGSLETSLQKSERACQEHERVTRDLEKRLETSKSGAATAQDRLYCLQQDFQSVREQHGKVQQDRDILNSSWARERANWQEERQALRSDLSRLQSLPSDTQIRHDLQLLREENAILILQSEQGEEGKAALVAEINRLKEENQMIQDANNNLAGHSNHRQKIHMHQIIKEENQALKAEHKKALEEITRLKFELKKSTLVNTDKENIHPTPMVKARTTARAPKSVGKALGDTSEASNSVT